MDLKTIAIGITLVGSTVFGTLVDKETGEKLVGAKIYNSGKVIYTDFDGNFELKINSPDTLKINFISYKDTTLVVY